jgi:hypothetical protein
MGLLIVILIILLLIGGIGTFPTWPHSTNWGYGPSGVIWLILVVVLIFWLLGRI